MTAAPGVGEAQSTRVRARPGIASEWEANATRPGASSRGHATPGGNDYQPGTAPAAGSHATRAASPGRALIDRDAAYTAGSMDTWTAVKTIRVVRRFSPDPLPPELLERILDAGRHAGSSKNLQRWAFIAVQERATLQELSVVGPWAGHLAGAAVGIALVTPDPAAADSPLSVLFDLGRAAQNMALTAWESGVGSVPATVYEHDLARRLLGYPAGWHCEYILSFGFPADAEKLTRPPKVGGRRTIEDVVHRERW